MGDASTARASITFSGRSSGTAPSSPSASSSRSSGARSSNSRKNSRRRDRSGGWARNSPRSMSTSTLRTAVASCLEMRASSAWFVRFSLRLAPEIWSMLSSTASSVPKRCRSSAAVFSPIPGTPGMLSEVSPLRP